MGLQGRGRKLAIRQRKGSLHCRWIICMKRRQEGRDDNCLQAGLDRRSDNLYKRRTRTRKSDNPKQHVHLLYDNCIDFSSDNFSYLFLKTIFLRSSILIYISSHGITYGFDLCISSPPSWIISLSVDTLINFTVKYALQTVVCFCSVFTVNSYSCSLFTVSRHDVFVTNVLGVER